MNSILVAFVSVILAVPFVTHAFPFGGRASTVLQCVFNSTIYANLGPPRGGEYIWTTATRTYQFGPPSHAGQWLLGLAGAPYYCIYRISPLTIYTGISISMMGSSGPGSPSAPPTRNPSLPSLASPSTPSTNPSSTPTPTPGPLPPPGVTGKVLISEVYYAVDTARGAKPANEWVEIYNDTLSAVNLSGWKIEDAIQSDTLPSGITLAPGKFIIVADSAATRTLWNLPQDVQFVALESPLGDGLANAGDRVLLRSDTGAIVDAVSWGTNTSAFVPSAQTASYGRSLSRVPFPADTNTASDWAERPPSPGK